VSIIPGGQECQIRTINTQCKLSRGQQRPTGDGYFRDAGSNLIFIIVKSLCISEVWIWQNPIFRELGIHGQYILGEGNWELEYSPPPPIYTPPITYGNESIARHNTYHSIQATRIVPLHLIMQHCNCIACNKNNKCLLSSTHITCLIHAWRLYMQDKMRCWADAPIIFVQQMQQYTLAYICGKKHIYQWQMLLFSFGTLAFRSACYYHLSYSL
jgi:hypothetical protein